MRLIDADRINYDIYEDDSGTKFVVIRIDDLSQIPTIEAEPVRHGRLTDITSDEWHAEWGDCSICGESNHANAKYCQWCGAKLDGESEV